MINTNQYKVLTGLQAATYFKYFRQDTNTFLHHKVELNRIAAKSFYNKHKEAFDKIAEVFAKYNIDLVKYIKFFVITYGKTEKDVDTDLTNMLYVNKFIENLQIKIQYKKIYSYFLKSAENIADDCIKLNYSNVKDYLRYLIKSKKLVNQYVAGRISCYYLCAIRNFKQIIPKMDKISQQEFSKILIRYDKYNIDVLEAFKLYKSNYVSPIKFTEELLWKKRNQINNKSKINNSK